MGIFSRIGDLLKANINDLIDRAEDPEKMVKQIISDLQKDVQQSTQALGKAMASERIAKRQYENAVKTSADWEAKAKAALAAGDVDLAKKALSHKVSADAEVESYQKMYEQIAAQTAQIREQVETLKSKLEEAKSRQAMLVARSQMAKTQKNLAQTVGGMDSSSALDKFDRMEQKVTQQEAEAAAFSEIAGSDSADAKTFEQLQHDMDVDTELQRLMSEMGQTEGSAM
ncbi:MAG: PspA/IM30 family protein [Ruminococcus sp.]|jgi:phage shock protein A|uniref:PspA/IM30 family protein n=1 Tax=Ruminococcus TaxID=1263 RepID=UPI00033E95ED|nr:MULTISPECIES: PspA/IM30 family protein [Ruminococcus]DAY62546.1 MAG TPA: shock protein A [Caudoviricetes sp.]MCB5775988.1 PspA/IM30 family protein [Ruminococcus callidus]MCC2759685.1 PspA/IM30 family protein [Ruminococcus callidus]MEE1398369.1 PspA/IM30 family protein [Ruminococcus sp.]CDE13717.1 phage shock protein A (IM30) suppresses sigma54-dependent transcription [Ruminococcus sp. CAG:330]